jgi:hypothetical protein
MMRAAQFPPNTGSLSILLAVLVTLCAGLISSGCAARNQAFNPQDYVEVDNPFGGDTPDANAKIWVPKASLEKGIPRGRDLVKKGYEKVVGQGGAAPELTDAATRPKSPLRLRLLLAESGQQSLGPGLLKVLGTAVIARQAPRPSEAEALSEPEALRYLAARSQENAGGPVLFLSKPEGTQPGARVKADLYDVRGPLLIRSFWVAIPAPAKDQAPADAVLAALKGLADTTLSALAWFPWYGKVVNVSGDRVYLDGGKESGLKAGQLLAVYRGGEPVKGVGFAPGPRVATLKVEEFFGSDGAIASSPEAGKVQPGDYLELERP